MTFPRFRHTAVDCPDAYALAEFYRQLLGWDYPAGRTAGPGDDWVNLANPDGGPSIAFQQTEGQRPSTWPDDAVPQQLHFDFSVPTSDELTAQRARVEELGGRMIFDRFDDPEEPLFVFTDPAGHPFCIFVAPES
jgi:predicted enzyme related to lactoylglutathione lyase